MAANYTTQGLDELDRICWLYYGGTQGTVEAVLAVNPNLSELLPLIPPGIVIFMPDLPQPQETVTLLRFWEPL